MLRRRGSRWELYPHKVRYMQHGQEHTQWALPSKQWWTDFADKWDHTDIIEFTDVGLTPEQLARFADIEYMPEDFTDAYTEYVLTGDVSPDIFPPTHPFRAVLLQKENAALRSRLEASEGAILGLMDVILMGGM